MWKSWLVGNRNIEGTKRERQRIPDSQNTPRPKPVKISLKRLGLDLAAAATASTGNLFAWAICSAVKENTNQSVASGVQFSSALRSSPAQRWWMEIALARAIDLDLDLHKSRGNPKRRFWHTALCACVVEAIICRWMTIVRPLVLIHRKESHRCDFFKSSNFGIFFWGNFFPSIFGL